MPGRALSSAMSDSSHLPDDTERPHRAGDQSVGRRARGARGEGSKRLVGRFVSEQPLSPCWLSGRGSASAFIVRGPRVPPLLWRRRVGSAPGGGRECAAGRVNTRSLEASDPLGQEGLGDGAEVVEADSALDGHPVVGPELDLAVDPADGTRDQRDDDVAKPWDRLLAGEDEDRAAAFLLKLQPDDVAARYQRSSRMASRALASAQASSLTSGSGESAH